MALYFCFNEGTGESKSIAGPLPDGADLLLVASSASAQALEGVNAKYSGDRRFDGAITIASPSGYSFALAKFRVRITNPATGLDLVDVTVGPGFGTANDAAAALAAAINNTGRVHYASSNAAILTAAGVQDGIGDHRLSIFGLCPQGYGNYEFAQPNWHAGASTHLGAPGAALSVTLTFQQPPKVLYAVKIMKKWENP